MTASIPRAMSHRGGVAAVERALSILEVVTEDRVSLAEITKRTLLVKSTAWRLIFSLEKFGYLMRLEDGSFRLGPKAHQIGALYQRHYASSDIVLPVLRRLVEELHEGASFYVQDGGKQICLHHVNASRAVGQVVQEGDPLPLSLGAAGHVLRAFSGGRGKRSNEVRQMMYSASFGELDPELAAIAAPVFGMNGKLMGGLTVSGPRHRLESLGIKRVVPVLFKCAKELTHAFGGDVDASERAGWRTAAATSSGRAACAVGRQIDDVRVRPGPAISSP
jgi:DNA-binding IclR family transcriptional regulator